MGGVTIGVDGVKHVEVDPGKWEEHVKGEEQQRLELLIELRLPIIYDIPHVWKRSGSPQHTQLVK